VSLNYYEGSMGADLTKLVDAEHRRGSRELNLSGKNLAEIPPQIAILKDTLEK
jgi:hypothetical protein